MPLAQPMGRSPQLLSGFLQDLQQPSTPFISPDRFADRVGFTQSRLAELAGVHRNTLRQNPAGETIQDAMRDMIRVISAATELTGDVDQALFWFRNEPIADYRGRTAVELVSAGKTDAVLMYLEDLTVGATG